MRRLRLWIIAFVALAATCAPGQAETEKSPVRFIVGVPAGGSIDLLARQLAEKMKDILGEPVLVENRAGANQRIALAEVRKSPPDARTLYIGTSGPFSILPNIYGDKLDYDPVKDFTPIARLVHFDLAIGVGAATPAQNLPELIAWLRANPQKASYGTPGAGTTSHFVGVMFARSLATPLIHVPYKGGTPAINDLVGGHIPMLINSLADMLEQHKAGNLRIVAATGPKRSALLPEVPTLKESGIPLVAYAWLGVCGGTGIPQPVVDLLNRHIVAIVSSPEYRTLVERSGSVAVSSTPAQFRKIIDDTAADAAPIIRELGVQLD